jgi:hypothetical protein
MVIIHTREGRWRKIGDVWVLLPTPVGPVGPVVAHLTESLGDELHLEGFDVGIPIVCVATGDPHEGLDALGDDHQEKLTRIAATAAERLAKRERARARRGPRA